MKNPQTPTISSMYMNGVSSYGALTGAVHSDHKALHFTNFVIRVRDLHQGQLKVEVLNSPVGRMRRPEVVSFNTDVVPYIKKLANPNLDGEMTTAEMVEMGQMLGDMLLPMSVRRMFVKSWSMHYSTHQKLIEGEERRGIRLLLELDDDNLAMMPWEYVYMLEYKHMREFEMGIAVKGDDIIGRLPKEEVMRGFLGMDPLISIVRHESFIGRPLPTKNSSKLKILLGVAEPKEFEKLDTLMEANQIKEAVDKANGLDEIFGSPTDNAEKLNGNTNGSHGRQPAEEKKNVTGEHSSGEQTADQKVDFVVESGFSRAKLKGCLAAQSPHIFHFAGHADFMYRSEVDPDGKIYALLEDTNVDNSDIEQEKRALSQDILMNKLGSVTQPAENTEGNDRGFMGPGRGFMGPGRGFMGPGRGFMGPGRGFMGPGRGFMGPGRGFMGPGRGFMGPGRGFELDDDESAENMAFNGLHEAADPRQGMIILEKETQHHWYDHTLERFKKEYKVELDKRDEQRREIEKNFDGELETIRLARIDLMFEYTPMKIFLNFISDHIEDGDKLVDEILESDEKETGTGLASIMHRVRSIWKSVQSLPLDAVKEGFMNMIENEASLIDNFELQKRLVLSNISRWRTFKLEVLKKEYHDEKAKYTSQLNGLKEHLSKLTDDIDRTRTEKDIDKLNAEHPYRLLDLFLNKFELEGKRLFNNGLFEDYIKDIGGYKKILETWEEVKTLKDDALWQKMGPLERETIIKWKKGTHDVVWADTLAKAIEDHNIAVEERNMDLLQKDLEKKRKLELKLRQAAISGSISSRTKKALKDVEKKLSEANLESGVQLVVLNGCQTARRDSRQLMAAGVATTLLKSAVPAVIGMQLRVNDEAAITFSESFYGALLEGHGLEYALASSRIAISKLPTRGQDWGIPILYLRSAAETESLFSGVNCP